MAIIIRTAEQAKELAEGLLDVRRPQPWCVISTPNDSNQAVFDVDAIEDEVASVCEVYVVWGGPATRTLQDLLPLDTHVFGGAGRTYPLDFGKTQGASVGKLRYVYPPGTVAQSTERLISDIWAAAMDAGLLKQATANAIDAVATVKQFFGDSVVLLQLTNGDLASVRQEACFPGVPLTWVFALDQQVAGKYDPATRIFTLKDQNLSAAQAVAHFGYDTITLGLVRETDRKRAIIAIHPNLEFEVSKAEITGNPLDVISEYLRVGEVWPVRIYRDPQGKTRLKMNDIDDDEPIAEALPLIPGGQPWLDQARYASFAGDDVPELEIVDSELVVLDSELAAVSEVEALPETPATDGPAPLSAAEAKDKAKRLYEQTIAYQRGELIRGNREIERLNNELNQLAGSYRDLNLNAQRWRDDASAYKQIVAESRKSKSAEVKSGSSAYSRRDRFNSLEEWFTEELRRTWLGLYSPDDRARFKLESKAFTFGAEFFDGVNPRDLDETELRKLLRVVVHLVTGRNGVEQIAESHALRVNNRPLMRGNDVGLRMHIENGQPQAKRLHYFKLAAGGYELTNVGDHDEFLD
jgi:hypothetical protein